MSRICHLIHINTDFEEEDRKYFSIEDGPIIESGAFRVITDAPTERLGQAQTNAKGTRKKKSGSGEYPKPLSWLSWN